MRFEYGTLAPLVAIEKRGFGKHDLFSLAKAEGSCGEWATDLLRRPEFKPSAVCERVEFTALSPRHFGWDRFSERPSVAALLDPSRLARWSVTHLHGQSIGLCEPDDAFYIRAAYRNQPEGDVLAVGMQPMLIHEGVEDDLGHEPWRAHGVFYVERACGVCWLRARYAMTTVDLDERWLFRLSRALPRTLR